MKCKLGDFCKTNTRSYSTKENWDEIHYLDTGNITAGKIADIQCLVPGVDTIPSRAKRKVQLNDIIYSTVRPNQCHYGIIKKYDPKMLVSTGFAVITVDSKVADPDYIYYFLTQREIVETLHAIGEQSTSAYPSIKPSDIENLEIDLPDLETQRAAATFLRSLDEKIEVNDKISENLQQQALALFTNYYKQSNTEVSFTDMIQILGGGTPKTGESKYWNGSIPFFTPKDVASPYTLTTEKNITEEGLSHCNSRLYPVNTVFVTARGTVGKVGLAGVPMAMNQSCYALVGKHIHQLLVYFYTLKAVDRLRHKASGAVFDAIVTRDFETEKVFSLSEDNTNSFVKIVEPMYQSIIIHSLENQTLIALRDSLLAKFLSGEIDASSISI